MTGRRALVVDDDRVARLMLRHMLAGLGFDSDEAADVDGARTALSGGGHALLVTDLSLPDGTGLDLLDAIRELPVPPWFVLITGINERHTISDARMGDVEHYLTKPISTADLELVLERLSEAAR